MTKFEKYWKSFKKGEVYFGAQRDSQIRNLCAQGKNYKEISDITGLDSEEVRRFVETYIQSARMSEVLSVHKNVYFGPMIESKMKDLYRHGANVKQIAAYFNDYGIEEEEVQEFIDDLKEDEKEEKSQVRKNEESDIADLERQLVQAREKLNNADLPENELFWERKIKYLSDVLRRLKKSQVQTDMKFIDDHGTFKMYQNGDSYRAVCTYSFGTHFDGKDYDGVEKEATMKCPTKEKYMGKTGDTSEYDITPAYVPLNDAGASTTETKSRTEKIIRHEGDKWILYSHEGKVLGTHPSKEKAEAQERAVEANKTAKDISPYGQHFIASSLLKTDEYDVDPTSSNINDMEPKKSQDDVLSQIDEIQEEISMIEDEYARAENRYDNSGGKDSKAKKEMMEADKKAAALRVKERKLRSKLEKFREEKSSQIEEKKALMKNAAEFIKSRKINFVNFWKASMNDSQKKKMIDEVVERFHEDDHNWKAKVASYLSSKGADKEDIDEVIEALLDSSLFTE
ncbi:MAG: hypothetical protein ACYDBV_13950 [Nitrospiria bacterium]